MGGVIGIAAIYSDSFVSLGGLPLTANIVTMAVFGAIVMYILSMWSLFALRKSQPDLPRSYRAPFYPVFPAIALGSAVICLVAMTYYNPLVAALFAAILGLGYIYFRLTHLARAATA